ncbi:MAG: hypothetical protein K2X87_23955 [Gemmataceae bacterium]|nr:hypothetical protein [Gemmataceae bacterium]
MRRDTFEEALRRVNRAAPFRHYTVELVSGECLIAYHPELFVIEDDLVIYEPSDKDLTYFDASCVARVVNSVVPPRRR